MLKRSGFTLSELLIALVIMGIIAAFIIPKIMAVRKAEEDMAIVKESMGAISTAFRIHQLKGLVNTETSSEDIMAYIHFVSVDTSATIDSWRNNPYIPGPTLPCGGDLKCYRLHNGSMLVVAPDHRFGGTDANNGIGFYIETDGKVSNKYGVAVFQYYDGHIRTAGNCRPNTTFESIAYGYYTLDPDPTYDPDWLTWD